MVLVTNQVTSKFGATSGGAGVTAALGALWAHAVNTRLVLENRGAGGRHLFIAKVCMVHLALFWMLTLFALQSPRCPVCSLQYHIDTTGAWLWSG